MKEKNDTLSKKSRLGEAFSYVLNQWDALCYYSDDGLAEVDNNTAERALRAVVNAKIIGRFGDADDFLDCFIIPARIVGGTFWD